MWTHCFSGNIISYCEEMCHGLFLLTCTFCGNLCVRTKKSFSRFRQISSASISPSELFIFYVCLPFDKYTTHAARVVPKLVQNHNRGGCYITLHIGERNMGNHCVSHPHTINLKPRRQIFLGHFGTQCWCQ